VNESRPSPVVHLELHTDDLTQAREFYGAFLHWRPRRQNESYLGLELGRGLSGGMVECGTRRTLWLPYVKVADITCATAQASELGATVLLEPREGPAGWRSVVSSPAGGEIALWQQKEWRA
jgi:uncharacterized protein